MWINDPICVVFLMACFSLRSKHKDAKWPRLQQIGLQAVYSLMHRFVHAATLNWRWISLAATTTHGRPVGSQIHSDTYHMSFHSANSRTYWSKWILNNSWRCIKNSPVITLPTLTERSSRLLEDLSAFVLTITSPAINRSLLIMW